MKKVLIILLLALDRCGLNLFSPFFFFFFFLIKHDSPLRLLGWLARTGI